MSELFNDTTNGKAGRLTFTDSGKGFTTFANARTEMVWLTVVILKDSSVTKSDTSGKGAFFPGCGRPGRSGTEIALIDAFV